jgi:hypothetical protein
VNSRPAWKPISKQKQNKTYIFKKMDGTGEHHVKRNNQTQKDKNHIFSHMWSLGKKKVLKVEEQRD